MELQDKICWCAREMQGSILVVEICQMSLEELDSLHETCERLEAQRVVHGAWIAMGAAQSNVKNMKDYLKPWIETMRRSEQGKDDLDEFLKIMSGGF